MARVRPSDFHAYLGRWKFDFVVKDQEVGQAELGVFKGFLNRASRLVHEGERAKQDYPLAIELAFRGLALKAAAPWCETMTPRNFIDDHEPDIVPVMRVLRAGIAEANKESHDAASRARLLLLVAATGRRFCASRRRLRTRRRSSGTGRGRNGRGSAG